MFIHVEVAIK